MKPQGRMLAILLVLSMAFSLSLEVVNAGAQTPISRLEAEERALNIINYTWTFSSAINTRIDSKYASSVTLPNQLKDLSSAKITGIPYNWGGLDSPYTSSYNAKWSGFSDAISKGAFAGNVNSEAGLGYIAGTAGLDCSGFVQAVFNIKDYKQSTSTLLNNYFTPIKLNEIQHMDVLIKTYDHVAIFDKWGTYNGIYGAYTYESTTDEAFGGIQGTKRYFMTMEEINDGYIPARYNYLKEDLPYPVKAGYFAKTSGSIYYANYRAKPSEFSPSIGVIPGNTIVYLIDYSQGWYQINYNGKTGWIWGELVESIPSGKYVTIKNAYLLNIRSNPYLTSPILGVLGQNQYAEVIGYSADGEWLKISINGVQGWSGKQYLNYIY